MRILVISDSHGARGVLYDIIKAEPSAKHIFFLGDMVRDIEDISEVFPDRIFHIVEGNCDGFTMYKVFDIEKIGSINILYTHGHRFGVKGSNGTILELAKKLGCKIALYGHTHVAVTDYRDGIHVVNPGSCAQSRQGPNSYGVIDIESGGIMPIIKSV